MQYPDVNSGGKIHLIYFGLITIRAIKDKPPEVPSRVLESQEVEAGATVMADSVLRPLFIHFPIIS